jgi:hypothetical protein
VVWQACKRDVKFYINSFMWVHEARLMGCRPMITWPDQNKYLDLLMRNVQESLKPLNRHLRFDVGCAKARDTGATVMTIGFLDWLCRFHEEVECLCISAKEDRVDNPKDQSALFQKLDYLEARLPNALQVRGNHTGPQFGRTSLRVYYPETKSIIVGESSNENAGRGGRYLVAFRDEEAACPNGHEITQSLFDTTRMQIRVSTPQGVGNSFHTAYMKKAMDWITLHWTGHPEKIRGLYSIEGGQVHVLDRQWHDEHPGYRFRTTETHADPGSPWEYLRSPWFDEIDDKADSAQVVAQNHQISFLGSGSPYFRAEKLANIRAKHQMEPIEQGNLADFVPKQKQKLMDADGRSNRAKLWFNVLSQSKRPPQDTTYSIGTDISAGMGASDSALSVIDDRTKEKVFEFYSNGMTPTEFAVATIAVMEWFTTPIGRPFIAWDMGGPGFQYAARLQEYPGLLCYRHENQSGDLAKTPGVPGSKTIKNELFESYRSAIFSELMVTHSEEAYKQCEQFVHDGTGGICHQSSLSTEDKSARGDQHGDIVTSECMAWRATENRPKPVAETPKAPYGSIAWDDQNQEEVEHTMFENVG